MEKNTRLQVLQNFGALQRVEKNLSIVGFHCGRDFVRFRSMTIPRSLLKYYFTYLEDLGFKVDDATKFGAIKGCSTNKSTVDVRLTHQLINGIW